MVLRSPKVIESFDGISKGSCLKLYKTEANKRQRNSGNSTNRLLRQYFLKVTDLSVHSQAKLSAVVRQLKERTRKTLDYETPSERFKASVASTG